MTRETQITLPEHAVDRDAPTLRPPASDVRWARWNGLQISWSRLDEERQRALGDFAALLELLELEDVEHLLALARRCAR